jgi:hypothetical protein
MFIAFGLTALGFGHHLAPGTSVRMGPGYVPRMLSFILLTLGSIIIMTSLYRTANKAERERYWIPLAGLTVAFLAFAQIPWGSSLIARDLMGGWMRQAYETMPIPFIVSATLVVASVILIILIAVFGRPEAQADDVVEPPKWKPITMVTIGIVAFALMFETTGMLPSLIVLILISSLGGDEFKLWEVVGNIVVLTILCIIVFKLGLGMNISVIQGVW